MTANGGATWGRGSMNSSAIFCNTPQSSMSLKDAVSALRSLKAELEASRAAKAELENAYRGVQEVRYISG